MTNEKIYELTLLLMLPSSK